MRKCGYYGKGYHLESSCMKKTNRHVDPTLGEEQHIPSWLLKEERRRIKFRRQGVHALVVGTSSSPSFIINSRASRHMVSTTEVFSSFDMSKDPPIVLGDNSLTDSMGKGRIDLDHGNFNNVLYVPGLSSNLLSVYQMTHTGLPNIRGNLGSKMGLIRKQANNKLLLVGIQEPIEFQ